MAAASMSGWSVIVCAPQRERKLGDALSEAGYDVFVPVYVAWRPKYGRWCSSPRPLISGYVFAMMEPHEIHAFHDDGAVRLLAMNWRHSLALAHKVQEWAQATAAGVFDEPEPVTAKPWLPKARRNRKGRRQRGEAKRTALDFKTGLEAILAEMSQIQPIAA